MPFYRVRIREQIETNVTVFASNIAAAEADALLFKTAPKDTIVRTNIQQPLTFTVQGTTNQVNDADNSLARRYAKQIAETTALSLGDFSTLNNIEITPEELTSLQAELNELTALLEIIK